MTFTYDTTISTDLAKVRLLIGDNDSAVPLLQDEEIQYFLTSAGSVYGGAVMACRAIAGRFSRLADTTTETVSVSYSQKAKQYFTLAEKIEKQGSNLTAGSGGGISATGISLAAIDSAERDTDRPASQFKNGMFSNPQSNQADEKWR